VLIDGLNLGRFCASQIAVFLLQRTEGRRLVKRSESRESRESTLLFVIGAMKMGARGS